MYLITDTQLKNSYSLKMKINAYKEFHIFACISVIKIFFIFLLNYFNVLMITFKKPQAYGRLQ